MKKGKFIGKIFGITLVFVMICGMLGGLPSIDNVEASSSYDRQAAYDYAQKYWDEVCSDGYFWDSAGTYVSLPLGTNVIGMSGFDCAHFVSCAIGNEPNEQGGGLDVPSRVPPTYGEPGAGKLGDWLIDSGNGVEKSSIAELEMGDVINYDWYGDGQWDHVALYLGNGEVAAHTESYWTPDEPLDWQLGGASNYRLIHITSVLPLDITLVNCDSRNFPFVYLTVMVSKDGQPVGDLTKDNFSVTEDSRLQTDMFDVVPPEQGGGLRMADIIFLIDNSGSMGSEITAVKNNCEIFADALAASEIDYRLGLVQFGQSANGGHPRLIGNGLTADVSEFKSWVATMPAGGSFEPGFEAIRFAIQSYNFRPGAQKVFILITDEESDDRDKQTTIDLILANDVTVHAAVDCSYSTSESDYCGPGSVREVSGGLLFSVTGDYTIILDTIQQEVANTYIIRYRTDNPVPDGIERTVVATVDDGISSGSVQCTYTPGGAPQIQRTQETLDLHGQSLVAGSSPTISVTVTDVTEPFVQSVTLSTRITGSDAGYDQIAMLPQADNIYAAQVPSNYVEAPGLDYYIRATDGQVTSSDPSTDPDKKPYQIAVLPNKAPVIEHTPPASWHAGIDVQLEINANDSTYGIEAIIVYYRRQGDLLWQTSSVTYAPTPTTYASETIILPVAVWDTPAIEYYLEVTDDLSVSSLQPEGGADAPFILTTTPPRNYGLFIGSHKPWSLEMGGYLPNNPHADAEALMASLNRYMHFSSITGVEHLMELEYEEDDNHDKIESTIIEIGNELTAEDKFVFYYSGHGATDDPEESTIQTLGVGYDEQLWDSELMTWLNDYIPVQSEKIIILDSCYSGGFWSDALVNVPNTILMASATEENFSYRHLITGRNLYTNQLIDGLIPTSPGDATAKADSDENGLTFQELHDWAFDNLLREKQNLEGDDLPVSPFYMPDGAYPWLEVTAGIHGSTELVNEVVGVASTENNPPIADAGPDQTVERNGDTDSEVILNGSGSFDPDGDSLSYEWTWDSGSVQGVDLTVNLQMGTTVVNLTVSDGEFSDTDTVAITIQDTGCFIATAAYGTPMAEEIGILREFRDEYLLTNPAGQALVDLYYKVSPPMAEFIAEHPSLKPIVRTGLVPVVVMSTIAVNTTMAENMAILGLLVFVSMAVAIWVTRRRCRGPQYT